MYPLQEGMFAPRQQWYVVAWSDEVRREPMERWVLDEPIALYRTEQGEAIALGGRCPHRHFPLGKSRVIGDTIECGYHGIRFGPDGAATLIPSQAVISSACRVHAYPLVERWKWLWIWMGNPEDADPSAIPSDDELGLDPPGFDSVGNVYYAVPGRYTLMHDNLLDLTHLNFLHRTNIAGGDIGETREERSSGSTWVSSIRHFRNLDCPPFFSSVFDFDGKVDRHVGLKGHLPAIHAGFDRYTRALDDPERPGEPLGEIRIFHAITPATLHSAHYFFGMSRNFALGDADFGQALMDGILPTLDEDMLATREIEGMLKSLGSTPPEILLKSDANCGRGRQILQDMILAEQKAASSLASTPSA